MTRSLRTQLLLPSIALLAGCGEPPVAVSPDAGPPPVIDASAPTSTPDAGPGPAPACTLEQLAAFERLRAGDVLVTQEHLFFAHAHALWRAEGFDGALERVASLEVREGYIRSIAAAGGSVFVLVAGNGARVLESEDGGRTWIDRGPGEGASSQARLLSNGERLLAADFNTIHELDRATGTWTALVPEAPEGTDHLAFQVVGFDGDAIVANDVYEGGMVRLAPGQAQWQRITGLGEWGYTSFAARGDLRITVNNTSIFTQVGGEWRVTHALEGTQDMEILDLGDRFLALDARRVLTSTDGMEWSASTVHEGFGIPRASHLGSRVAWLSAQGLALSEDGGQSWTARELTVDQVSEISLHDGVLYADAFGWRVSRDGIPWQLAGWPSSNVAMTDDGAWACADGYCGLYLDDGGTALSVTMRAPHLAPARIFATSHGLFLAENALWNEACYATIRPGLARLDAATRTVVDASAGLRADPVAEPSSCAGLPSAWSVQNVVEVGGVLFASVVDNDWGRGVDGALRPGVASATFRSEDGGAHWTEVAAGDFLVAATEASSGLFALFTERGLAQSRDGGRTFDAVAGAPEGITDLVALDGRLAVSTSAWAGPSVWLSANAVEWTPIAELGPIHDLDAHAGTLGIATRTNGAWLAQGCY